MAQLHAGIPQECTLATVNRQCSSGLQAISVIANAISSGDIDIGIGAGAEKHVQSLYCTHASPGQKVDTLIFVCV